MFLSLQKTLHSVLHSKMLHFTCFMSPTIKTGPHRLSLLSHLCPHNSSYKSTEKLGDFLRGSHRLLAVWNSKLSQQMNTNRSGFIGWCWNFAYALCMDMYGVICSINIFLKSHFNWLHLKKKKKGCIFPCVSQERQIISRFSFPPKRDLIWGD